MRIKLEQKNLPAEGHGCILLLDSGREIAIFCVKGKYYAIDNLCPHQGGPLGEGSLEGDIVTCPWHSWQFNVTTGTGENSWDFDEETVRSYPIEKIGDDIFLIMGDD